VNTAQAAELIRKFLGRLRSLDRLMEWIKQRRISLRPEIEG
jgi:hypothetical protein